MRRAIAFAALPLAALACATAAPGPIQKRSYTCADGRRIEARYDNSNPEQPMATIEVDGRSFAMFNVRAASGARYSTESGLRPDHGLQWWVKGDSATLSEMLMDHTAPGAVELTTCTMER